jgi:hypothetical protein
MLLQILTEQELKEAMSLDVIKAVFPQPLNCEMEKNLRTIA